MVVGGLQLFSEKGVSLSVVESQAMCQEAMVPLPESEEIKSILFYFSPLTVCSKFCIIKVFNLMKMMTNMHISRF